MCSVFFFFFVDFYRFFSQKCHLIHLYEIFFSSTLIRFFNPIAKQEKHHNIYLILTYSMLQLYIVLQNYDLDTQVLLECKQILLGSITIHTYVFPMFTRNIITIYYIHFTTQQIHHDKTGLKKITVYIKITMYNILCTLYLPTIIYLNTNIYA